MDGGGVDLEVVWTYDGRGYASGYTTTVGLVEAAVWRSDGVLSGRDWHWSGGTAPVVYGGSTPPSSQVGPTYDAELRYHHGADGRLLRREWNGAVASLLPGAGATLRYGYDGLGRLGTVSHDNGVVLEAFDYDLMGNMSTLVRRNGAGSVLSSWSYQIDALNEVSARQEAGGALEWLPRDTQTGRVARSERYGAGGGWLGTEAYAYDGSGELWSLTQTSPGGASRDIRYWHDVEGDVVRRDETVGGVATNEYWFEGWQRESSGGGRTVEHVLPMLDVVTTGTQRQVVWLLREYDGHVLVESDNQGNALGAELLGGYGTMLASSGSHREEGGFHGMEEEREVGLTRMGVRHVRSGDGVWLQPEPLLAFGLKGNIIRTPRYVSSGYANGSPTTLADWGGFRPVSIGPGSGDAAERQISLFVDIRIESAYDSLDTYVNKIIESGDGDVDSIHIYGHGSFGAQGFGFGKFIRLGDVVDYENSISKDESMSVRAEYVKSLVGWAKLLPSDGEIVFHGCRVGRSTAFLSAIARVTGRRVSASPNAQHLGLVSWLGEYELQGDVVSCSPGVPCTHEEGSLDELINLYHMDFKSEANCNKGECSSE